MDIKDIVAVGGSAFLALLSALTLIFSWPEFLASLLVCLVDVYLILVFVECALRSSKPGSWDRVFLSLPHRAWALLQIFLLVSTVVVAFATLFLASNEVRHLVRDVDEASVGEYTDSLDGPAEAIYFSAVTITTLGYGEFSPAGPLARRLIVFELASGLLLLVLALPIVSTRAASLS